MEYFENPKNRLIENIIGPVGNYLLERNIAPMIIPTILFGILLYFLIYHNRPQGKKLNMKEKYEIGLFIFCVIMTIIMQIVLFLRPYHKEIIFGM
ncbi:MAG TPA: hypothetical protein DEE98_04300 [Elusimicrobia bacterium]|nr:MAG: hypothetical protein A2278_07315 [Elusimicrobia bacterium RIFOXYA12_FULL_49_49]OGS10159.1 MAG: hypothetical protein A2386_06895 [Elusimicrobia bacterium RIFOXYB1_FULL_48_9]OGS16158.1 MAG: hypothetical protein A2251_00870 [Elusimicrobia bacterium RIFOXYA2_FULL_47_53]OGS31312.1 MAG: hypothetical protein A2323_09160 [Elusimicrobia bacterium RIFOXYB2_FULL_46_23]HBU69587.1 hypothetical protein [Elusimicrobiota bacterium]